MVNLLICVGLFFPIFVIDNKIKFLSRYFFIQCQNQRYLNDFTKFKSQGQRSPQDQKVKINAIIFWPYYSTDSLLTKVGTGACIPEFGSWFFMEWCEWIGWPILVQDQPWSTSHHIFHWWTSCYWDKDVKMVASPLGFGLHKRWSTIAHMIAGAPVLIPTCFPCTKPI